MRKLPCLPYGQIKSHDRLRVALTNMGCQALQQFHSIWLIVRCRCTPNAMRFNFQSLAPAMFSNILQKVHWTFVTLDQWWPTKFKALQCLQKKKSSGIPDKRRVLSVEQVQNLGPWRPYRPTKNLFPKLITLISPSIKDAAGYQSNQPGNHPVGGCANVKLPRVKSTLDCRHCESAATLAPPIRLRSLTCPKKEPGEKVSSGTWQPGFHLGVVFPQRPRKPQCL